MKTIIKIIALLIFTSLVSTCATISKVDYGGLGRGRDSVPLSGRVLSGHLPNGLRYYILENSLPENRAHLALVVNAGSVLEREDERGFAHFIEHLAFNGTARFPKLELVEYLRSLGMRFGADANAYTSYDETVYHFDVPVENINGVKSIPQRALAILDDWSYAVSFNEEDVESEKRVILEEMRSRLGAMERVRRITLPILFEGSAFADRHPIGLSHIIENATSGQLKEFYDRYYTSDNMALIFVGDFDGKALEKDLARHFNMPRAAQRVNRPRNELPPPKNGNFNIEIITDQELTSSSYMIYYKQKQGEKRGTIAYYRKSIIDYLISLMISARFNEKTSNPEAAATESWGGIWNWSENTSFYSLGTQPKTGNAEQALKELLLEKEAVRRFGFTESEFIRAKLNLVSYMERMLSEKDRTESRTFVRGFTNNFLYGEDMADIEWEVNAVKSILPGITLTEISRSARDYFAANDINLFLIAPQAEESSLPSKQRIWQIFNEAQYELITQRKDFSISGELLESIPVPGNISNEIIDSQTGAHIITLSNGARVILKETANRNNEIIMYAMALGGTNNVPPQENLSARLTAEMVNVSGLGPYSRTELVNKLAGKQVSASFWSSTSYRGFQGSSTTQDINTLFEMIHLFFTQPNLDERAISAMIDQYRTSLIHQEDNPQQFFSRELSRIIFGGHPNYKPFELEDMDRVSVEHANKYLLRCINPADYTFIFTGNLDIDAMRHLLEFYIASIPNSASMRNWESLELKRPSGGRRTIYKGIEQRTMVFLAWFAQGAPGFDEHRNQTASVLTEYINIVLNDEIREKMGGVYSISSGVSISVIPMSENMLTVSFVCDPSRADELIAAVKNQLLNLTRQPLDTDIYNKAREALLMGHERSMQQNLHIAQSYANSSVLYSTALNRLNLRPDVIRSVTAQNVQALSRQILSIEPIEIVLFPDR
ncbi:MAG: insulinase family protein [Treponema sp.]|nr:insulinase family protein [Treponema sp.]